MVYLKTTDQDGDIIAEREYIVVIDEDGYKTSQLSKETEYYYDEIYGEYKEIYYYNEYEECIRYEKIIIETGEMVYGEYVEYTYGEHDLPTSGAVYTYYDGEWNLYQEVEYVCFERWNGEEYEYYIERISATYYYEDGEFEINEYEEYYDEYMECWGTRIIRCTYTFWDGSYEVMEFYGDGGIKSFVEYDADGNIVSEEYYDEWGNVIW